MSKRQREEEEDVEECGEKRCKREDGAKDKMFLARTRMALGEEGYLVFLSLISNRDAEKLVVAKGIADLFLLAGYPELLDEFCSFVPCSLRIPLFLIRIHHPATITRRVQRDWSFCSLPEKPVTESSGKARAREFLDKVHRTIPAASFAELQLILRSFKAKRTSSVDLIPEVSKILNGHQDLLMEFQSFLPSRFSQ